LYHTIIKKKMQQKITNCMNIYTYIYVYSKLLYIKNIKKYIFNILNNEIIEINQNWEIINFFKKKLMEFTKKK